MTDTDPRLAFEDLNVGDSFPLGPYTMREADTVRFAKVFDPQPLHLDREVARQSLLRELSASGWHTAAIVMRLFYQSYAHKVRSLGSPGIAHVDWPSAVFVGDTVVGHGEILELRPSRSRPNLGIATIRMALKGRDDKDVLRTQWTVMIGRRHPAEAAAVQASSHSRATVPVPGIDNHESPNASMLWFETLPMEKTFHLGEARITADEIKVFAREFDPQPFHVDDAAADAGPFGGLSASGWHTCGLWMRANVLTRAAVVAGLPESERQPIITNGIVGIGCRDISWPRPVRPDVPLHSYVTLESKQESRSMPDWGLVRLRAEMIDGAGELVLRVYPTILIPRKIG